VNDLRSTGMVVPNLMDFTAAENIDPSQAFFKRDHHWTPEGARLASRAVGKALSELPDYRELGKASYQSAAVSQAQIKHTMAQEIQRLCQGEIPPEPYPQYETRLLAQGDDGNADLFGSAENTGSLVLVGTSFSAEGHFNFDGFLSESTGLEVANHAISGGQLFNAMVSFTASPQFDESDARFMLWEAPSYYNLNRDSAGAFRQIIPAVQGPCADDAVVASAPITVRQGEASGSLNVDPGLTVGGKD
jgi:alginate biosynthesis protein AlgX